jgi:hypothetical protein
MPNHTDTFNPTESVIPNDGDLVFDSTGEGGRSPTETVLPYIEQRVGEADNGGIIINWTSGDGPNGPKGDSVGVIAIITPTEHDDGGIIVNWTLAPPARANAWRASVPPVRRAEMVLVRASSSIGLAATARATMHFPLRPSIPWTFIPASIFFSDHQPQGKPGSRCRPGGDSTLSRRAPGGPWLSRIDHRQPHRGRLRKRKGNMPRNIRDGGSESSQVSHHGRPAMSQSSFPSEDLLQFEVLLCF